MTYSKPVYETARARIRARQEERDALISARKTALFARFPRLKELDDEASSLAFRIFNEVSDGTRAPDEVAQQLERELTRIANERTEILRADGKAPDYFSPPYVCDQCRDTGFSEGRMCSCLNTLLTEELFARSNLSERMRGQTFASMRSDIYSSAVHPQLGCSVREYMKNIRDICLDFTASFGTSAQNLLFYGASGLGKTYYSSAIANELIQKGTAVLYMSAVELFATLQRKNFSSIPAEREEYDRLHQSLLTAELLILDDLGTEMITNFSLSELFSILNGRLLDQKPMIINTNLDLTELKETYSERISSRLAGSFTLCHFVGDDLRLTARP